MQTLILDHPAWQTQPDGTHIRVTTLQGGDGAALVTCAGGGLQVQHLAGDGQPPAPADTAASDLPAKAPAELRGPLTGFGRVIRVPNPSLWDAVTTAVLRQVIRAPQARALYLRWRRDHGTVVATPAGVMHATPSPERVLALPEAAFGASRATFHRTALRAAAEAYLEHAGVWEKLAAPDLAAELVSVPRIGPWTAAAAAADFTGDFSVYPCGDLAVRTWAKHVAPDLDWPDTNMAFARRWKSWTTNHRNLHALTLFTLTWGNHVRITGTGGTAPGT